MSENRDLNSHHWEVISNEEISIRVDAWHCANAFASLDAEEQARFFRYLYEITKNWKNSPGFQWAWMEDELRKLDTPVRSFIVDFSDYLLREELAGNE